MKRKPVKVPRLLAVFLSGPIISKTKMKDVACHFKPRSTTRAAVKNSIMRLRTIITSEAFTHVLIIGDTENEAADRNWMTDADAINRCKMNPRDVRFFKWDELEFQLRKIGVSHAVIDDPNLIGKLPTVSHMYVLGDAEPFKVTRGTQTIYNIKGGWDELQKVLEEFS